MTDTIYARIEEAQQLPRAGPVGLRAREKYDIDFKKFADKAKSWEHAKDIAAFANALGGVILVGADGERGDALEYPGLKNQSVAEVKSIYENAAKMCSPTPVVDVVPITLLDGGIVVAVNVNPFVEQIVAAPAGTRDKEGHLCAHKEAWVFPIRRASQTEFILPENLPMYMNREIRRAVLLLARIPVVARNEIVVHFHAPLDSGNRPWNGTVQVSQLSLGLGDVSVEKNRVQFILHGSALCGVPLLDVLDVWNPLDGKWEIKISGNLQRVKPGQFESLVYRPLPH